MKQSDTCGQHLQQQRDDYLLPHHPLSKSFQYRKEKKTLQKVIHLSWKTPDKSLGKWLEKSKEENVLKKDFELPHVDKGVRQLLRSNKRKTICDSRPLRKTK